MALIEGWREKWKKLWSIRLNLLAAALTALAEAIPYLAGTNPPTWLPLANVVINLAAAAVRLIAQPEIHNDATDQKS